MHYLKNTVFEEEQGHEGRGIKICCAGSEGRHATGGEN